MSSIASKPGIKSLLGHMMWPMVTKVASARSIHGNTGLIYAFHYIGEPVIPGLGEDLFLAPEMFAKVLDFINAELRPLDPLEFITRLEAGTLPERATLLTFDDGTRDGYTRALPELQKRGLKACFFVCPGLIGNGRTIPCLELMDVCARAATGEHDLAFDFVKAAETREIRVKLTIDGTSQSRAAAYRVLFGYMFKSVTSQHAAMVSGLAKQLGVDETVPPSYPLASWEELEAMHAAGMWIANHTMLHSTCDVDQPEQFGRDVAEAFRLLDERVPLPKRIFCYPYGEAYNVNEHSTRILQELGTHAAFVTQGGAARSDKHGMLHLHREDATYSSGSAKLAPLLALVR